MADKIPLKLTTGPNEIREFVAGDTVPETHLPNTLVKLTGAQTLVDKTLDPTTVASQLMAVGVTPARVVEFVSTGTATNYDAVKLTTQAAGNGAIVSAVTSATPANADLKVQGLGTGNVLVRNNSTDMGIVVGTTGTQTLSGKTLTTPTISSTGFTNAQHAHSDAASGGTLSAAALPTDVLYGTNFYNVDNKTLLSNNRIQSTLLESTGTVPALSVGLTGAPTTSDYSCPKVVANVAGSGAVLSVESSAINSNLILSGKGSGLVTTSNGTVVGTTGVQTLLNKTLTTPTLIQPGIQDFNSAQHDHSSPDKGGFINAAAIGSGSFSQDRIANAANRSGGYAQGRGNAVLIDSLDAAGSNGNARWAQRSRVAQVQAANYLVSSGVGTATYAACSNLQINLTPISGFSFNTTPDCIVDTTGGGTTLSNSSKKGKTIRLTLNGSVTASAIRTANLQFRYLLSAAPILTVSLQAASIPIGSHNWTAVAYAVYHGYQNNIGNMHIWIESFKIFQAGASIDGIGVAGSSFTPALIQDGDTTYFDANMQFTVGAASDAILCYNAIWEVLN